MGCGARIHDAQIGTWLGSDPMVYAYYYESSFYKMGGKNEKDDLFSVFTFD